MFKPTITFNMRPSVERISVARKQLKDLMETERANLVSKAAYDKVNIVHVFDSANPKGGLTVAFRKVSPYTNGNMVKVAVATCSALDNFNRKLGTQLALNKFYDDETIELPLSSGWADEDLNGIVKTCFSALYNSRSYQ